MTLLTIGFFAVWFYWTVCDYHSGYPPVGKGKTMSKPTYTDDGGHVHTEGDRAYDYYSMKPGVIGKPVAVSDGWFEFHHDGGRTITLNGQRICTLAHAKRMRWPNAE